MLVVISDLHFEEETSDNIPGDDVNPAVTFSRNLPAKVFRSFIVHLANEARRNGTSHLDLVLAGDIFDLHRTSLWFQNNPANVRPYVNNQLIDQDLEKFALKILLSIQQEPEVNKSLVAFRMLGAGKYWNQGEKSFPVPVKLHYIPGNHDRLLNSTKLMRANVQEALGMPESNESFNHVLVFPGEGAIVRHGHEYDRYNFARDYSQADTIPLHIPSSEYDVSPFGDFATVDLASRIPQLFRQHHTDSKIRSDRVLRTIYLRLLEFDDLRPQRAILNFLLNTPESHVDSSIVWKAIEPIIYALLEKVHDDPFLKESLEKMDKKWRLDAIDVIQTTLALKSWRLAGIPLGLAQFISNTVLGNWRDEPGVETLASKEKVIQSGEYRFVVAGHTHRPNVALIASDEIGERYYIDTGTWRNRVPATPDYKAFGRLKSLSYAIIYGPGEDKGESAQTGKVSSIDFWSGVTQRWYS